MDMPDGLLIGLVVGRPIDGLVVGLDGKVVGLSGFAIGCSGRGLSGLSGLYGGLL